MLSRLVRTLIATLGLIGPAMAQERLVITSDWGRVTAELVDNNATRALVQMLPLTIEMRDHLRQEKTALRRSNDGSGVLPVSASEPFEDVVERLDGSAEEAATACDELARHGFDVRTVRHDEHGLPRHRLDVAVEEQRNLPGVRRTNDEREPHPVDSRPGPGRLTEPGPRERPEIPRFSAQGFRRAQEAFFGRRPRRATDRPPIRSASWSVTSSSRTPLRASRKVIRTVAPFPSAISSPDMSDTRTVFFAMYSSDFACSVTRSARQRERAAR